MMAADVLVSDYSSIFLDFALTGKPAVVYVPDLDINTEGKDPADAIDMAADAIGLWGISAQALGREIPAPSAALPACAPPQMAAYALVDLDAYHGDPV